MVLNEKKKGGIIVETNQEKAKQLIGEENYNRLIENGYMPIEMDNLQTFLNHEKTIKDLNAKVRRMERIQCVGKIPKKERIN